MRETTTVSGWTRERYYMLMALLLLVGLSWIVATRATGPAEAPVTAAPRPGFLAPEFELPTLDGNRVRLSDLRGKRVVINFWATWCPPCRAEMPAFVEAYARYRDQGLVILAVNEAEDAAQVAAFQEAFGLTFPVLLDTRMEVGQRYRVQFLPTTYFVGPDGTILDKVEGGMTRATVLARVQHLMEAR